MVNTYAAQPGGCRFESLWGFGFSLKGAYYEVGYCGKKTFLAGLQCTLTSSCAIKLTQRKAAFIFDSKKFCESKYVKYLNQLGKIFETKSAETSFNWHWKCDKNERRHLPFLIQKSIERSATQNITRSFEVWDDESDFQLFQRIWQVLDAGKISMIF